MILDDIFTMISDSATYRNMITSSFVYVWIYDEGISNLATTKSQYEPTTAVMNTDSVATAVEAAHSFLISPTVFWLLHMHVYLCIHYGLYFRNIHDVTSSALCLFLSLVASTGNTYYRTFSCVNSFVTDTSPCSLNFLNPVRSAHCVMVIWSMWISLSDFVIISTILSVFRCILPLPSFYPILWGLVWSLISWFWLDILQSIILNFPLLLKLIFFWHYCQHLHFLLWSDLVCLPLEFLLPQPYYRYHIFLIIILTVWMLLIIIIHILMFIIRFHLRCWVY